MYAVFPFNVIEHYARLRMPKQTDYWWPFSSVFSRGFSVKKSICWLHSSFFSRYVHPRFDLILGLILNGIEHFVSIFYMNFSYSGNFLLRKIVAILRNVFHIYRIISWMEILLLFCLENNNHSSTMQNVEDTIATSNLSNFPTFSSVHKLKSNIDEAEKSR